MIRLLQFDKTDTRRAGNFNTFLILIHYVVLQSFFVEHYAFVVICILTQTITINAIQTTVADMTYKHARCIMKHTDKSQQQSRLSNSPSRNMFQGWWKTWRLPFVTTAISPPLFGLNIILEHGSSSQGCSSGTSELKLPFLSHSQVSIFPIQFLACTSLSVHAVQSELRLLLLQAMSDMKPSCEPACRKSARNAREFRTRQVL